MHERDEAIINSYTIFDDLKGKIPKTGPNKTFISIYKKFPLISTNTKLDSNKLRKNLFIYFDIKGQRYSYIVLSEPNMKIYGSYCTDGDPFNSLIEELSKYENRQVTVIYPRKQIFDQYAPKKFHAIWDSFTLVEPNYKEEFLKNQINWTTENPFYLIQKKFTHKDISAVINKGKVLNVVQKPKSKKGIQLQHQGQFRIDEVLV